MMLSKFRSDLERFVDLDDPLSRPFVCNGSPLDCQIFIVGFNPARHLKKSFLNYWNDNTGFNKDQWLVDFYQQHNNARTRNVIERIANSALQKVTLDTNIYWYPTSKARDLKEENKMTGGIKFLMRQIKPKVVFVHNNKAIEFFTKHCSAFDDHDEVNLQPVTWKDSKFAIEFEIGLLCSRGPLYRKGYGSAARIGQDLAHGLAKVFNRPG